MVLLHFDLQIQISQEAGKVVWYSHLFKNFPQFVVIHMVKGFSTVNEAEVDVFLEFPCFFYDPTDTGNLTSGSSAFSKSSLNIWNFLVHILLKPSLENFEHYFASVWDECNCVVVWTFFVIAFFWDWNENWPLPALGIVNFNAILTGMYWFSLWLKLTSLCCLMILSIYSYTYIDLIYIYTVCKKFKIYIYIHFGFIDIFTICFWSLFSNCLHF